MKDKRKYSIYKITLIINGVIAGTTDFQEQHENFVKKNPKTLAIGFVVHECNYVQVLYNKKFRNLIDACQKMQDNWKEFGKILGYTHLIDLRNINRNDIVISVTYMLNNEIITGFWKNKKATNMKKELQLLENMQKINNNIYMKIDYVLP